MASAAAAALLAAIAFSGVPSNARGAFGRPACPQPGSRCPLAGAAARHALPLTSQGAWRRAKLLRERTTPRMLLDLPAAAAPSLAADLSALAADASSAALADAPALADPLRYAFMLPVAACVSTSCQLAGIGGAALFSPIFLLVFPALGPQFPLASPAAAIASALLTEVFGFASGLSGYARRGLVDWRTTRQFAAVSVPSALCGALCAGSVAAEPGVLREVYAALMLGLAAFLSLAPKPAALAELAADECAVDGEGEVRTKALPDGRVLSFRAAPRGSAGSAGATAGGSFLTGLLGVGVGEVLLPQLVRTQCMPLPLAAGTSVATVVVTAAAAAAVQFAALAAATGGDFAAAVPWDLVRFTVPGVLVGGQLAPLIASRGLLDDEAVERFAAGLFAVVGCAFAAKAALG